MGRTTLKIKITDQELLNSDKKQDISCFSNPFTYCCIKNKKQIYTIAQTPQEELYPEEWDPSPISKNKETEAQDNNLNT